MGRPSEGRSVESGPAFNKAILPAMEGVYKAVAYVWANGLVKVQVLSGRTMFAACTELNCRVKLSLVPAGKERIYI